MPSLIHFGEFALDPQSGELRRALHDRATKPRFVETFPRLGYRFILPPEGTAHGSQNSANGRNSSTSSDVSRIEALAVLPLENLSGDPAEEYFSDGMTAELISALASIGSLRVISRTSAMTYRG